MNSGLVLILAAAASAVLVALSLRLRGLTAALVAAYVAGRRTSRWRRRC